MYRFRLLFISLIIFLVIPWGIFSQTPDMKGPKTFYTDIEGHHGYGEGQGRTEAEALRLAKAEAIDFVFRELKKDDMFIEIFISKWPEAIVLEDSIVQEVEEGVFEARVQIKVDQQAVLMTEQTYQESVLNLLDRAEAILDEVEPKVKTAQGHEENLRLGEAYINYKQAENRLDELQLLLDPLGDSSLQSNKGNSKPAIISVARTLRKTVESGLKRLVDIEKETEVSEATLEIQKTYALLLEEKMKVDSVISTYLPMSPFYDLRRSKLEAILQEIQQAMDLSEEIGGKLKTLGEEIPFDKVYLREKINLSYKEAEQQEETLERLERELKDEIRLPRLVRQERAQKAKQFKEKLGYVLLRREPRDIFILRYYLPFGVNTGPNARFGLTREFEIKMAVEYYFTEFFWFQTALWKDDLYLEPDIKDIAFSQEVHLGLGRNFLVGGGASWDWGRWVKNSVSTEPAASHFSVDAFIGGIDSERQWPWGLFILKVPFRPGILLFDKHLNLCLELQLRIAHIFQIEAGLSSGFYYLAAAKDISAVKSNPGTYVQYQLRYFGLFGVRLPKPFMWGLRFEGGSEGPSQPVPMLFRLFVQYSI